MERSPLTGVKLSSVVPATVTGNNKTRELTSMDLAVKLHYVRSVYFFKPSPSVRSITIDNFKGPFFRLLQISDPSVSGRIRRSESDNPTSRPFVRCNDSGVRIVEATVEGFTVEEWLSAGDRTIDYEYLVYDQVLGPDLDFSPLVVFQMTRFKCGGISIGLDWAHVLGDAFSASAFMNALSLVLAGQEIPKPLYPEKIGHKYPVHEKAFSIKKIEPVGNHWLHTNACKMGIQTFCLGSKQIQNLMARYPALGKTLSVVEILYAVVWRSMLNVHKGSNPKIISICEGRRTETCSNNGMVISTVDIGGLPKEGDSSVLELATLIAEKKIVENGAIESMIDRDGGVSDYILYGAKLTFVNLGEADVYRFELDGEKPEYVNYMIHSVGDEGVVMVLQGNQDKGKLAKVVIMVIPEEQLAKLEGELKKYWDVI